MIVWLAGMPFIVPETGSRTRQLVERKFRDAGVALRITMQLPGTEGVKRAVEAGLGIGMVSGYAVEAECRTGVLRRVPIGGWRLTRPMNLVYRAQKYFSPVGARFREFARSYGAEHLARTREKVEEVAHEVGGREVSEPPARRDRRKSRGRAVS
jgi:DNA-binding transcriptional LysR family regulator